MTRCWSFTVLLLSVLVVACGGSKPDDVFTPSLIPDGADSGTPAPTQPAIKVIATGTPVTSEAGDRATFTVLLGSKPAAPVVVPVASDKETEIKVDPAALTFTPDDWDKPKTVTLIGQNEDVDDGDQKVKIALGPSTSPDSIWNGVRADAVEALNRDDDTAGIEVSSPTPTATTTESGEKAMFTVRLKSRPAATVTVAVTSSAPTEGKPDKASLVFGPDDWQTPQTVTVTGQDDASADGDKDYTIDLAKPATMDDAYAALSAQTVALKNLDDDIPGFFVFPPSTTNKFTTEAGGTTSFSLRLRSKPSADVTIPVSSTKTTEGSLTITQLVFTPANYDTVQSVTVTGVDDKIDDGDVDYEITLGAATSADAGYNGQDPPNIDLTNKDDDTAAILVSAPTANVTSETGTQVTFTVRLQSQPTATVTLSVTSNKPTEGKVDKDELVFDAGNWDQLQTVTVTGVDDKVDDGDQAYTIALAHKVGAVTTDAKYAAIDPSDVNLTNADDDMAGVTVSDPRGGTGTTEGGAFVYIDVVLNTKPTGDVTIPVSISNTEASADVTELKFTADNWDTIQSVKVTGKDDDVDDGDQDFTVIFGTASGGGYGTIDPRDITMKNADDDTAGIVVSALTGAVTELGGQAKFKVRLASRPAGTSQVSIPVTLSASAPATLSGATLPLVFTTATWNVDQEVTVTGKGNAKIDLTSSTFDIVLGAATSGDPLYSGMNPDDFVGISNATACGNNQTDATEGESCDDANDDSCDGCDHCEKRSWVTLPSGSAMTASSAIVTAAGNTMCVEGWAKLGASGDGFIAASMTSDTDVAFALRCDSAGKLSFGSQTAVETLYAEAAATTCRDGSFHHFAGCRVDTAGAITYTVYQDGAVAATTAVPGTIAAIGTAATLTFGAALSAGTMGFDGAIDEVRVSKVDRYGGAAYTPSRRFTGTPGANTVALWHFDEGTGTSGASAVGGATYAATLGAGADWAIDSGYSASMCP